MSRIIKNGSCIRSFSSNISSNGSLLGALKQRFSLTSDREVAQLLGISPQDFSNRKRRGTLQQLIGAWMLREGVELNLSCPFEEIASSDHGLQTTTLISREVLAEILHTVEVIQKQSGLQPSDVKKAELIATIYELRAEGKEIDRDTVHRMLRLAC